MTSNDKKTMELLLEYMGVCISNVDGSDIKKALFLVGKGNTGKSRLRLLAEKLIGSEHCTSCDISELEERFGMSMLYGKRIAGAPDMSAMNVRELKRFKSITGGDHLNMEFKGKDHFQAKYVGFFWFGANEMPKFGGDKGEWTYDRMIIVSCNNVVPPEKQDKKLLDKMYAERESIIVLLVNALKKFIERERKFDIPESCKLSADEYKVANSSVLMFYKSAAAKEKQQGTTAPQSSFMRYLRRGQKQTESTYPLNKAFGKSLPGISLTGIRISF